MLLLLLLLLRWWWWIWKWRRCGLCRCYDFVVYFLTDQSHLDVDLSVGLDWQEHLDRRLIHSLSIRRHRVRIRTGLQHFDLPQNFRCPRCGAASVLHRINGDARFRLRYLTRLDRHVVELEHKLVVSIQSLHFSRIFNSDARGVFYGWLTFPLVNLFVLAVHLPFFLNNESLFFLLVTGDSLSDAPAISPPSLSPSFARKTLADV